MWRKTAIEAEEVLKMTYADFFYEIKNKFYDEGFEDWTVADVLERFPMEWDWSYEGGNDYIIEI